MESQTPILTPAGFSDSEDTLHLLTVEEGTATQRIDSFLANHLPDLSRSQAQKLLLEGKVTRLEKALTKKDKISFGDTIQIRIPPPLPIEALPENIPLDVPYEDEDVIVINKPVGMVVHPAPAHWEGTLVNALLYHCGDSLSGIGGAIRPGIVHRIDRDTSGLLIVAKHDKAHLHLTAQLQDRSLKRLYVALTQGRLKEDSGEISAPIGRHPVHRKKMAVTPQGREAITHYHVLREFSQNSYVECALKTGRTHQIRVHMAHLGHPLLGDTLYGHPYKGLVGQCLHAKYLQFISPSSGKLVTVEAPLPPWFSQLLEKLERKER